MPSPKKWVPVGKILREWGVGGQVKCVCFNPTSNLFSQIEEIFLEDAQGPRRLPLEGVKRHGKFWLLKLPGYDNPEIAQELRQITLLMPRESLPAPESGEIYLTDLEGLKVLGPDGEELGTIQGILNIGDSEVLEVGFNPQQTFMVPYEDDFVAKTSLKEGVIFLRELAKDLFEKKS